MAANEKADEGTTDDRTMPVAVSERPPRRSTDRALDAGGRYVARSSARPGSEPPTDAAPLHATSSSAVISRIETEAKSLTAEEQRHLHSHLVTNAVGRLNEETYRSTHVFKELSITFQNLRANSKAFLTIQPDQRAIWAEGDESNRLVGLSVSTDIDPVLYLRNFLINAREMFLQTYQDCSAVEIQLYVRTEQNHVKGRVDLPPGSAVTLQSRNDRTTLIGLSSFSIDLA